MGGAGGDQLAVDGNHMCNVPYDPTPGTRSVSVDNRDAAGIFIGIDIGDGEGIEY